MPFKNPADKKAWRRAHRAEQRGYVAKYRDTVKGILAHAHGHVVDNAKRRLG